MSDDLENDSIRSTLKIIRFFWYGFIKISLRTNFHAVASDSSAANILEEFRIAKKNRSIVGNKRAKFRRVRADFVQFFFLWVFISREPNCCDGAKKEENCRCPRRHKKNRKKQKKEAENQKKNEVEECARRSFVGRRRSGRSWTTNWWRTGVKCRTRRRKNFDRVGETPQKIEKNFNKNNQSKKKGGQAKRSKFSDFFQQNSVKLGKTRYGSVGRRTVLRKLGKKN